MGGPGELVVANRVVGEADEGDAVADDLDECDFRAPDDDGDDDEENVFQDASEGHDQARCLANLC